MEFPITDLLDHEQSTQWIMEHFHPDGLKCPGCGAGVSEARAFRQTRKSQLTVYRCRGCEQTYNLYSGTLFQQHHLTPMQVVLLGRGVCKGEPTSVLASELGLSYGSVLNMRHALQANAEWLQPEAPLPDSRTETDEMFQNAGEKRRQTR